jgi:hypothetical protein
MPSTSTRSAGATFALQATVLGLVIGALLLAGWTLAGISPLEVLAMVMQAIRDMWTALKAFAGFITSPVIALFA